MVEPCGALNLDPAKRATRFSWFGSDRFVVLPVTGPYRFPVRCLDQQFFRCSISLKLQQTQALFFEVENVVWLDQLQRSITNEQAFGLREDETATMRGVMPCRLTAFTLAPIRTRYSNTLNLFLDIAACKIESSALLMGSLMPTFQK
jgi:hypothetical protein